MPPCRLPSPCSLLVARIAPTTPCRSPCRYCLCCRCLSHRLCRRHRRYRWHRLFRRPRLQLRRHPPHRLMPPCHLPLPGSSPMAQRLVPTPCHRLSHPSLCRRPLCLRYRRRRCRHPFRRLRLHLCCRSPHHLMPPCRLPPLGLPPMAREAPTTRCHRLSSSSPCRSCPRSKAKRLVPRTREGSD